MSDREPHGWLEVRTLDRPRCLFCFLFCSAAQVWYDMEGGCFDLSGPVAWVDCLLQKRPSAVFWTRVSCPRVLSPAIDVSLSMSALSVLWRFRCLSA